MIIRRAELKDNKALCLLDSLCTQGQGLVFYYQRVDFFLRPRLYDNWAVYLAEENGSVIGSISTSLKKVRLGSSYVKVGYFFDLRVHPDQRRQGIAVDLIQAAAEHVLKEGAQYAYTYVLGSNQLAMTLVGKLNMFTAASFRIFFLSTLDDSSGNQALIRSFNQGITSDPFINTENYFRNYDFYPRGGFLRYFSGSEPALTSSFPQPFCGYFNLPAGSSVQGGLWDSSVLSTKVIERVPLTLRAAAAMPHFARKLMGLPRMPPRGKPLRIYHLFDVVWEEVNPSQARNLITGIRVRAGIEGGQVVICHLDTRDPLCDLVKKQAFFFMEGTLLLRTPLAGEKPPPVSRAYFDVRDF